MMSPDKPWVPGTHPEYTALTIKVNICVDEHNNVWSDHEFSTAADESISIELSQGGVPQIAHALLTEAVRREVFMCALLQQTKDPVFVQRCVTASTEERSVVERDLIEAAQHVIVSTLPKMLPGIVKEVLEMMAGSLSDS